MSTIGLAGLAATGMASAATNQSGQDTLVDKIAQKFNLNKDDVQQVFNEQHQAREAEHQAKISERLQKLVDDQTITPDQKTAIEAKLKELHDQHEANKDSLKDLTPEERKAKREQARQDLENWANEQGLDLTKLRGIFQGPHMGPGGPGHGPEGGNENPSTDN